MAGIEYMDDYSVNAFAYIDHQARYSRLYSYFENKSDLVQNPNHSETRLT